MTLKFTNVNSIKCVQQMTCWLADHFHFLRFSLSLLSLCHFHSWFLRNPFPLTFSTFSHRRNIPSTSLRSSPSNFCSSLFFPQPALSYIPSPLLSASHKPPVSLPVPKFCFPTPLHLSPVSFSPLLPISFLSHHPSFSFLDLLRPSLTLPFPICLRQCLFFLYFLFFPYSDFFMLCTRFFFSFVLIFFRHIILCLLCCSVLS